MSLPEKLAPELFPLNVTSGFKRGFLAINGEDLKTALLVAVRFKLIEEGTNETLFPPSIKTIIHCPHCKQKHTAYMGLPTTVRCIEVKCGGCHHVFISLRMGVSDQVCTSCEDRVDCLSLPVTGSFRQYKSRQKKC